MQILGDDGSDHLRHRFLVSLLLVALVLFQINAIFKATLLLQLLDLRQESKSTRRKSGCLGLHLQFQVLGRRHLGLFSLRVDVQIGEEFVVDLDGSFAFVLHGIESIQSVVVAGICSVPLLPI